MDQDGVGVQSLYTLRVQIGTQRHNFVNVFYSFLWIFPTEKLSCEADLLIEVIKLWPLPI